MSILISYTHLGLLKKLILHTAITANLIPGEEDINEENMEKWFNTEHKKKLSREEIVRWAVKIKKLIN